MAMTTILFLLLLFLSRSISAVDLIFNGFSPSNLVLYGDASFQGGHLSLTNTSFFSVGRALLPSPVTFIPPNSSSVVPFFTSFVFSIAPIETAQPGHGIALLFAPLPGLLGATAAQHLGLFNRSTDADPTNRVLAVELDVFQNEEFHDIDSNHVGVDIFSLTSNVSQTAGYYPDSSSFVPFELNSGHNYQAWVDYSASTLNVTLAPAGTPKPRRPLISTSINLSFFRPEMYVGFCAATGKLVEHHRILAWSFSTTNLTLSDALITAGLPSFVPSQSSSSSRNRKPLIAGVSIAVIFFAFVLVAAAFLVLRRRKGRPKGGNNTGEDEEAPMEIWESEYWPHRIGYAEIYAATDGFEERNLIGSGGNGRVYKGVLAGEAVAVKRFHRRGEGVELKGFLAEVSSLGRLRHRNIVGLKGWCKRGDDLILVYEYMENGSLEGRLFGGEGAPLDWKSRVRILKDVAEGVLYLHEGWERVVVHRDIKASNVLLDAAMAARLGDFGQARVREGAMAGTTSVVGTAGYMAPEVVRSGKAGVAADVYAFGVLALEVAIGRRGVEGVVKWARGVVQRGEEEEVVARGSAGDYEEGEGTKLVRIGVWCTGEEAAGRPAMREVVRALEGTEEGDMVEERATSAAAAAAAARSGKASPIECCYRSALGLDPDHQHPTWDGMGLSNSAASVSDSDGLVVGR